MILQKKFHTLPEILKYQCSGLKLTTLGSDPERTLCRLDTDIPDSHIAFFYLLLRLTYLHFG